MRRLRPLAALLALSLSGCAGLPYTTEALAPVLPDLPAAIQADIQLWAVMLAPLFLF